MAGSGKGKQKKGKKQSKPRNDSVNKQPGMSTGTSNYDYNVSNVKSDNMNAVQKSKDENPHAEFELKMDMSRWENNNERTLELLLYNKFESLYAEALKKILDLGYDAYKARIAILMNGHRHGRKSLLRNIVNNSVEFLQSKGIITDKDAPQGYKHMSDRIKSLMRSLITEMQILHPDCDKAYTMKQLLGIGAANSTQTQSAGCIKGESSAENSAGHNIETKARDHNHGDASRIIELVPEEDLEATVPEDLLLPEEFEASPEYPCDLFTSDDPDLEDSFLLQLLDKTPEDPKDLIILSVLKKCRELKEQVKERRKWALEKAAQAEQKVNSHLSELQRLRQENLERRKINADEKVLLKRNLKKLREMDISLWNALAQLEQSTAAVRQLELQNAEIMEDIERCRLDSSKSNETLRGVEKRERKYLKKLEAMEEEKSLLQQQVEEQKQKVVQLNEESFQLNKVQEEAEAKLVKEKTEKEVAIALLAEEERLKNMSEANLRSEQAALRQRVEMNRLVLKDDLCRLEEELAKLQIGQLEIFEAVPPEYILLDSPEESPSDRQCIKCSMKDASVLFLPCAHQVLCLKCNMGTSCPLCHVHIDERVTIHGANP